MASLQQQRQISPRAGPAAPTATPLPSISQALAFVPPPMGPSSPPHRHHIQLPPLASLFASPQPQRHAHIIDGLCPVQAQARPNHFGDSGVRPQLRPRAVPSVIHLKNQTNVGTSSGHQHQPEQQPRPRRQQPLDWIDLTCNVEEKYDRKLQLPPFKSSHRGHGTWCIRFGSAADGPTCPSELGSTPKTTTSADGEVEKRCAHCGTRSTPEWRRGPTGRGTLCNACGLKYTKTLQAQRRKGNTGSTLGAVPLASLLNGPEDRKRRTSLSSPMVWQTKVKNFVSSSPSPSSSSSSSSSSSPSPSPSSSSSTTLSASFPPAHLFGGASSLSSFSVSPTASSSGSSGSPRKRARTQSLPNAPTHQ